MHSGHTPIGHDFLGEALPRMHMVLYNCISGVKGFSAKAMDFINDLGERGDSMISEEVWKGEERFMARRGLGILAKLYVKGYDNLLGQYKEGFAYEPFASAVDGIVLQLRPARRWEKRYETNTAYDVVMAVPAWGRVIAFSTTDMVSQTDPNSIKRYERIHIENFHFYPFFNRAHGVRGRSVVQERSISSPDLIRDFSFLVRTCADANLIGKSARLSAFTPVETQRGLQLGFYFGVVCKVSVVRSARSATGFGTNLGMTKLTLSDGTGDFSANLNTKIFLESLTLPCNSQTSGLIKDPLKLPEYQGWLLVLCAWLFGQDSPSVAAIQFLGDRTDLHELSFQAFMRTRRKAHMDGDVAEWLKKVDHKMILNSSNNVVDGKWIYYKQAEWAAPIFVASLMKRFKTLSVSDIVKTGASFAECRSWEQSFSSFIRANPQLLDMYLAEDPKSVLKKMFNEDPKGERPNDPLAGVYKCAKCNMAFTESQFPAGTLKRCMKCSLPVEPYQNEEELVRRRKAVPRRVKASRFLGSDPWLKSLFD